MNSSPLSRAYKILTTLRKYTEKLMHDCPPDAHFIDIIVRRDGKETRTEGDYLKHLARLLTDFLN